MVPWLFRTNWHRHPFLVNLTDANITHFLQLWLSEPIKFFYQKVNANCTPNTVISINLLSGFCAVEATISSYKISPSEYFDDVERNLGYYKQPPLSVTRVQYFEIIQRLAASESWHGWLLVLLVGILYNFKALLLEGNFCASYLLFTWLTFPISINSTHVHFVPV